MEYNTLNKEGILNRGNWYRLKQLFRRLKEGEKLSIGFIGGSITQGCLAEKHEQCYSYLIYQWFVNKFPDASIKYINAGIGGTTSQFGVARADDDLLSFQPDLIVAEFSVNDDAIGDENRVMEAYEGLIRKCYYSETCPAVVIMNNVRYDTGENEEKLHNTIGVYYGIPCISMRSSIYPLVQDKVIDGKKIAPDDLHPNNLGHEMISKVMIYFFESVLHDTESLDPKQEKMIPPLTRNSYEGSKRFRNTDIVPEKLGFVDDYRIQEGITDPFKKGWLARKLHSKITFHIQGTGIAVQYRKTVNRPSPIAKIVIDDDSDNAIILDGNFEEDWGDCVYLQTVLEHAEYKMRKVEIELIETHENDKEPFYLISIISI